MNSKERKNSELLARFASGNVSREEETEVLDLMSKNNDIRDEIDDLNSLFEIIREAKPLGEEPDWVSMSSEISALCDLEDERKQTGLWFRIRQQFSIKTIGFSAVLIAAAALFFVLQSGNAPLQESPLEVAHENNKPQPVQLESLDPDEGNEYLYELAKNEISNEDLEDLPAELPEVNLNEMDLNDDTDILGIEVVADLDDGIEDEPLDDEGVFSDESWIENLSDEELESLDKWLATEKTG